MTCPLVASVSSAAAPEEFGRSWGTAAINLITRKTFVRLPPRTRLPIASHQWPCVHPMVMFSSRSRRGGRKID